MFAFRKPSRATIREFLRRQRDANFNYSQVGSTRGAAPNGYAVDHNRVRLGSGRLDFEAACRALRGWAMFSTGWTELHRPKTPILEGEVVAMLVGPLGGLSRLGIWSLNACRIVYVINETGGQIDRFGFAYGTLPCHVECGEERFSIEWRHSDDEVHFDLYAFSRPNHLLAKIGHRYARHLQARFVTDSLQGMVRETARLRGDRPDDASSATSRSASLHEGNV